MSGCLHERIHNQIIQEKIMREWTKKAMFKGSVKPIFL